MNDFSPEEIKAFAERLTSIYPFLDALDAKTIYEPILLYTNDTYQTPLYVDFYNSSPEVIYIYQREHNMMFHLNIDEPGGMYLGNLTQSDQYYLNLFPFNIRIMSNIHPDKRANDTDVEGLKRTWEINRIIND